MTDEVELGFETIGNATTICYDRGPRLATDPWITGEPYFGSWTLSHEIPERQRLAIDACPYLWISHGHPDHLSAPSLAELEGKTVLLPDHVGGRIATALRRDGHHVRILADRRWVQLSERIAVCSIADYNQDGILLVDIGGVLVVNLNDATDHGWRSFVKRTIRRHPRSFYLHIAPWGDADMCNLFDESGTRLPRFPHPRPVGETVAVQAEMFDARYAIPFSSMHQYQRTDSAWANESTIRPDQWVEGFASARVELLPAFVQYDALADSAEPLDPAPIEPDLRPPEDFGDDWDQTLGTDEMDEVRRYITSVRHVGAHFSFVAFVVGGVEHHIGLGGGRAAPGLTFSAPRASLLTAVRNDIFDDLLIGNFMRTTLHGTTDSGILYPHFTPYVGKFADNGQARTREELDSYFSQYRRRAPLDYLRYRLEARSIDVFRRMVPEESTLRRAGRTIYERAVSRRVVNH